MFHFRGVWLGLRLRTCFDFFFFYRVVVVVVLGDGFQIGRFVAVVVWIWMCCGDFFGFSIGFLYEIEVVFVPLFL